MLIMLQRCQNKRHHGLKRGIKSQKSEVIVCQEQTTTTSRTRLTILRILRIQIILRIQTTLKTAKRTARMAIITAQTTAQRTTTTNLCGTRKQGLYRPCFFVYRISRDKNFYCKSKINMLL